MLIEYRPYERRSEHLHILITPDGDVIELPKGQYLTGTDDLLFFVNDVWMSTPYDLYSYDVITGEKLLLISDADVYTGVTDGTWLYTNVPWARRTDCWKLIYNTAGKLTGLKLWKGDV